MFILSGYTGALPVRHVVSYESSIRAHVIDSRVSLMCLDDDENDAISNERFSPFVVRQTARGNDDNLSRFLAPVQTSRNPTCRRASGCGGENFP